MSKEDLAGPPEARGAGAFPPNPPENPFDALNARNMALMMVLPWAAALTVGAEMAQEAARMGAPAMAFETL